MAFADIPKMATAMPIGTLLWLKLSLRMSTLLLFKADTVTSPMSTPAPMAAAISPPKAKALPCAPLT
jgi:hypothetical protein